MTKTVKAADFKQTCLALMDDVEATGSSILITKRGKPVARLVPVEQERPQALGCLRDAIEILDEDFTLPAWKVSPRKGRA
jgi:prevent-host-death family protein